MSHVYERYETVIGLEVHIELKTASKIFCGCKTAFGGKPNTQVCPICVGLPGTLPTLNKHAVELGIKAGLATDCSISLLSFFDRKNYFYPDLPKAYQISQNDIPLCRDGYVNITVNGKTKRIRIERIHLEEDAGKLTHTEGGTLIDYNRCGVPLIEIVSRPDIRSAEEAKAYLSELRLIMMYAGVSDCKMNEGSFRCDVNLSVRKIGDRLLGVRTEMKNINSFAFVAEAIEYESKRQIDLLESGGRVLMETRRFDSDTGKTYTMRVKESAADYRFFRDPDLPPFEISQSTVDTVKNDLPLLPKELRKILKDNYGLADDTVEIIVSRPAMSSYFLRSAELTAYPRTVANLMVSELLGTQAADEFAPAVSWERLSAVAELFGNGEINSSTVKKLLSMLEKDAVSTPEELVERHGMRQINDRRLLRCELDKVFENTPKLFEDYKNGKIAAKKAIIGKVMAATGGKANPIILNELFEEITK